MSLAKLKTSSQTTGRLLEVGNHGTKFDSTRRLIWRHVVETSSFILWRHLGVEWWRLLTAASQVVKPALSFDGSAELASCLKSVDSIHAFGNVCTCEIMMSLV